MKAKFSTEDFEYIIMNHKEKGLFLFVPKESKDITVKDIESTFKRGEIERVDKAGCWLKLRGDLNVK